MAKPGLIPVPSIEQRIVVLRRQSVIMDADLADLYGVSTRRLNEQVRRNRDRFPPDFVFQLTSREKEKVVAECDHLAKLRFSPHLPLAYTEHGAIMAANVLSSEQAIQMSVFVVRAFIRLRRMVAAQGEMLRKIDELARRVGTHDEAIQSIIFALRKLMDPPSPPHHRIGFTEDPGSAA